MYSQSFKRASRRIGRRTRFVRKMRITALCAALVFMLFVVVAVARADFLKVKDVEYRGALSMDTAILDADIREYLGQSYLFVFPKANILLLSTGKIENVLRSKYKKFAHVDVDRSLTRNLVVNITEHEAFYIFCRYGADCFDMTTAGLVFAPHVQLEGDTRVIWRDNIEGNLILRTVLEEGVRKSAEHLIATLAVLGFETTEVELGQKDKFVLHTTRGRVYYNLEDDVSITARNLTFLITELLKKDPNYRADYFDARFGNKIYYK